MTAYRARVLTPLSPTAARLIPDAVVVVDERGRIGEVGEFDGRRIDEDLRPGLLTPGFCDAHLHYPQTRVIGSAAGPLLEWLERTVFPEEARFGEPGYAAEVASEFCRRLGAAGTTLAMVYSSAHTVACDALFGELERRGLRAFAGPVLMDQAVPAEHSRSADDALGGLDELRRRWHGRHGRLHAAVIPRFALSCSEELLRRAADYASAHDLPITTHLAESSEECRRVRERFGTSYLEVYARAGLVRRGSVLAHCVHLEATQWRALASAGAVVAHCPDSNDFLGSGSMPVGAALGSGVAIAVGSDVAAGRTFSIPRVLSAAFDTALRGGVRLPLETLLWWGTRGGCLALGQTDVGEIAPGRWADLALHGTDAALETAAQALSALFFRPDTTAVTRTIVAGRTVWSAGDP